jgi:hypothetical protein
LPVSTLEIASAVRPIFSPSSAYVSPDCLRRVLTCPPMQVFKCLLVARSRLGPTQI